MSKFIQLHFLTSYPPSNPNRDDLGRPKTAKMGGVDRLRISSQSLKRAWRTSDICKEALSDKIGKRTKFLGKEAYDILIENGAKEKDAKTWAQKIASQFGKLKKENKDAPLVDLEIEQLVHVSPDELEAIKNLSKTLATESREPSENELKLLRKNTEAIDVALFGRMLASSPEHNIDAAAQVSHAISVNPVVIEDDFFTAVDDLNNTDENAGSSHLGDSGFSAGVFYVYVCINKTLLIENLNGNEVLANQGIKAFTEAALTVAPSGKQNSFANRVRASYALAEIGSQQPRSLAVAFLDPVRENDQITSAIQRLNTQRINMDKIYGNCYDNSNHFTVTNEKGEPEGSMQELLKFISQ